MRAVIKFGSLTLVLLSLVIPEVVRAQGIVLGPDGKPVQQSFSLPYGFYNDKFGAAVGFAYGTAGYPQPQSTMLITAMGGSESSGMIFLIGNNLQVPFFNRLFLDPIVSVGYFSDTTSYASGKTIYEGQQAGDNDSNKTDHIIGDGWDNYFRLNFKYLLPIGTGEEHIISVYKFNRGILTSGAQGGQSWNPFKSGKTYLELRPFYRSQEVDGKYGDFRSKTNGFDFSVFWDNRDLPANPSTGNSIRLKLSRDFGWLNSTSSWTAVFAEADKYFSLGSSDWFRQRVIALDFWTGYSPTWDDQPDSTVENRPPIYAGAFLGGLWRMRAYPSQRFSDRAAIYYGAELRMIPEWNPFDYWEWLQKHLGVQWVQLVPFAEVGRVAPDWGVERLHSDMKWDAGFGFRFLAKGLVLRIDSAYCDEGFSTQMMISQPFQF